MKIENDLSGADAERLADCISFAAKHGLSIGEYTQAGLNQNSGNVFLYDEDWPACVYQDIGFNGPCFSWSCPECGEETDCETLAEVEDLAEYYSKTEGCKECKPETKGEK